ncbi:GTPase HflX [Ruminococcaceae bacterium OttesenSCG-928-O06]|nr:GTPase HflX [Ruminococcaceae bacterium OttesenSCG-928-O06]
MEENRNILFPGAQDAPAPAEEAPGQTPPEGPEKVVLLAADLGRYDAERSMAELGALAEAAGMQPVAEVLQKRQRPDAATVIGRGRLAEAALLAHNLGAVRAIFDGELTGSQLRNIEDALGIPVLDRTMLILDIFKSRAVTREGKTQTELAMLEYRLPRLLGHGQSLSRQGGGGAGGAGARRGGGETKLEYDRRYIRSRIAILKKRLAEMQSRRDETRRARTKSGVPIIALVGYTNVGKSSLVNALAGSDIAAADMLFATLDPTARRLSLPDGQAAVLVDTVGFVSRLPHNLVEAFKSTLEEAKYADLLLLVADASDPEAAVQLATTWEVLEGLGITRDTPHLTVYNKCDLAAAARPFAAEELYVSARTGQGLDALLAAMAKALSARVCRVQVLLPYTKLALAEHLRASGNVTVEDYREDGVYYEATVEAAKAHLFAPYLHGPAPGGEGEEEAPPNEEA